MGPVSSMLYYALAFSYEVSGTFDFSSAVWPSYFSTTRSNWNSYNVHCGAICSWQYQEWQMIFLFRVSIYHTREVCPPSYCILEGSRRRCPFWFSVQNNSNVFHSVEPVHLRTPFSSFSALVLLLWRRHGYNLLLSLSLIRFPNLDTWRRLAVERKFWSWYGSIWTHVGLSDTSFAFSDADARRYKENTRKIRFVLGLSDVT